MAEHEFIDRLFYFWDVSCRGALSLQDLVSGLDGVMFNDLMENIEWFFNLHDKNKDGFLTKDEVLTSCESLLFIFRFEVGDAYLGAVSRFMTNIFEYGDALLADNQLEQPNGDNEPPVSPSQLEHNQPYLNLATFRMVVLADEILESFFETDLSASFRLEPLPDLDQPPPSAGLLGDIWSSIATDGNKKIFHKVTDEIGKTIGKHQVIHRPSIGRYTALQEPKARESLLTSSMRHSSSSSSLKSPNGDLTNIPLTPPTVSSQPTKAPDSPLDMRQYPTLTLPIVQAAMMERTPFAIDDAKDDDEESDEDLGDTGDAVLDEVDAFLEAHDSGLTDADKEVAKDLLHAKPLK